MNAVPIESALATTPTVTALIDTYNYGHFLEEAIDSVLAQDYPGECIEILVIDDGSTDDTSDRVKKYGKRIQYFQKPNGGQATAFNLGFQHANGEIVAFLDADDYWCPGKLSKVVEAFAENPEAGLVYHRLTNLNFETGVRSEGLYSQCSGFLPDDPTALLAYRVLPTSALAFRRSILARMMPMPDWMRLQADAYLALLAIFLAPVLGVPEDLAVYRIHGKNLHAENANNAGQRGERLSMRENIFAAVARWLDEHGIDTHRREVSLFFEQLYLFSQAEGFAYQAPGRMEFLRYMMRYTRLHWSDGPRKLSLLNALNTVLAPLLGYKNFGQVYKKEIHLVNLFRKTASERI